MTVAPEERFMSKLVRTDDGCLIYQGATQKGYGVFSINGNSVKAHRYAYELVKGPIPEGVTVDHECHNSALAQGMCAPGPCHHRSCCDPEHMVIRSMWENTRQGGSFSAVHARKQNCPQGHEYSGVNSRGERICRTCQNAAARRYREKKRPDGTIIIVRDEPEE